MGASVWPHELGLLSCTRSRRRSLCEAFGTVSEFGYTGAHTLFFRNDVRVEDVRWLMQYLGKSYRCADSNGLQIRGSHAGRRGVLHTVAPRPDRTIARDHGKVVKSHVYVDLPKVRIGSSAFRERLSELPRQGSGSCSCSNSTADRGPNGS